MNACPVQNAHHEPTLTSEGWFLFVCYRKANLVHMACPACGYHDEEVALIGANLPLGEYGNEICKKN
jgi:hypothetical protein